MERNKSLMILMFRSHPVKFHGNGNMDRLSFLHEDIYQVSYDEIINRLLGKVPDCQQHIPLLMII
jgi:hypothetical protein